MDLEAQIKACRENYAFMDGFRGWWQKYVRPTKKVIINARGDEVRFYEDMYEIISRNNFARDELVELCVKWNADRLT